ncbi:hypothetical protein HA48_17080 [Pantoea wallisii]|uniref:Uncharacterized protein n=1 Tax=Pantoea wallisii TaxID=1076551 RepID=A0A1X1D2T6_9GAMM|nr:hypothetical protein HA48_17080 [Pantoea wallisii]
MSACSLKSLVKISLLSAILFVANYQLYLPMLQRNIVTFVDFSLRQGFNDAEFLYGLIMLALSMSESLILFLLATLFIRPWKKRA